MAFKNGDASASNLFFMLDDLRCALSLNAVERVIRSVEITPLPKAPQIVLGVINVEGRIIPVIDIRDRFRLPPRDLHIGDRFIIAKTPSRSVAIWADSVQGVGVVANQDITNVEQSLPFAEYLKGIAKTKDGIVLIYDLDSFLSLDEERKLTECLPERST